METPATPETIDDQPRQLGASAVIVDDARLLQLSREPKLVLFPVLDRAKAIRPLVLLLALIPFVYAADGIVLHERDARWGLHVAATDVSDIAIGRADTPAENEDPVLKSVPPLGVWLTAFSMRVFGLGNNIGLFTTSVAATMLLILALFRLVCNLTDERHAMIAALLLVICTPILHLATNAVPDSLGLLACAACLWGFASHRKHSEHPVSIKLLVSGICLGLAVLSTGAISIAIVVVLILFTLGACMSSRDGSKSGNILNEIVTLLSVIAAGSAVGGWWIWTVRSQLTQSVFFAGWDGIIPPGSDGTSSSLTSFEAFSSATKLITQSLGVMIGLTISGIAHAVVEMIRGMGHRRSQADELRNTVSEDRCDSRFALCSLSMSWMLVSAVILVWLIHTHATESTIESATQFVTLPCLLLASMACRRIIDRQIGTYETATIIAVSLVAFVATTESAIGNSIWEAKDGWLTGFVLAGIVLIPFGWAVYSHQKPKRERWMLQSMLILLMAGNIWHAVAHRTEDSSQTRMLRELQQQLQSTNKNILMADQLPPAELRFVLLTARQNSTLLLDGDSTAGMATRSDESTGPTVRAVVESIRVDLSTTVNSSQPIVVLWTATGTDGGEPISVIPGLAPVLAPRLYENRILAAYRVEEAER